MVTFPLKRNKESRDNYFMKKRYLAVILLAMFSFLINGKALVVGDCDVLLSYKQNSSLDEDKYICKGRVYGVSTDSIYYSGTGNVVKINNFKAYYMVNYGEVTLDISGNNEVSLFHANSNIVNVTGNGLFKFKEVSYVKKVINGGSVFNYEFNGTMVLDENKKIYEGTNTEFISNYETLKKINKLSETFNYDDYVVSAVNDYTKSTPVVVSDTWFTQHINTNLNTSITGDGFGLVEYVKEEETKQEEKQVVVSEASTKKDDNTLESNNVIFVSEKKLNKKYKLSVEDKKEKEVAKKIDELLEDSNLLDLYDISVTNGKKEVSMKNGKYTIKIKLDEGYDKYTDFKVIYVNDDEIKEYIDATIVDGYLVFETSHLSQYGIVATPIVTEYSIIYSNINDDINYVSWLKVLFLLSLLIISFSLISLIALKSNLIKPRKKKRRA